MSLRRLLLLVVALTVASAFTPVHSASAAVTCPNPVPVVDENNCHGAGSANWRLQSYNQNIAGYSTKTSANLGEDVVLKIARNGAAANSTKVNIQVYRIGYYGGAGGRLIPGASQDNVTVNNTQACLPMDAVTGKLDCGNWQNTYTIPGASLPASGVYIARIVATDNSWDNHIIFTVRDDARNPGSKLLFVLPTASYQAYNNWGGKSLYWDRNGGAETVAGTQRAVKVSYNRPLDAADVERNRFRGVDYPLVYWLEREGYDVSYTDDLQAHSDRPALLRHEALVASGHSEYWSGEQLANFKAARDAGVDIASFSANTAYWKVRYEDGGRTLVCYKTVQGSGTDGSGTVSANDWGPDGLEGTADDALGADGRAGTADDHPENSTTTFRDNGAPPGDPNAPPEGRVGPDTPENSLFGVMYFGDHEFQTYPLQVPAASGDEFAGSSIWRHAGLSQTATTSIGTDLVGWEWDAIPTQSQYTSKQPAGVKRVARSSTPTANWIQDEGRKYATSPPSGQPAVADSVEYRAPGGALVFASGTMQWANALAYSVDSRIWQSTYNLFSDMNVQPGTPEGVILDSTVNQAPTASFTATPNPVAVNDSVHFDASASDDSDGPITKYEWDLDGNGSFETDTGTTPSASNSYGSAGQVAVKLRVTDNQGTTGETTVTVSITQNAGSGSYSQRVLGTAGLQHYWRMGELTGTSLADSRGGSPATISGASLGAPGAVPGDTDTAVSFDGAANSASAPVNLSATGRATVEFWLKWDGYADDDDLAFELTPNFNQNPGGLLVDPNAPQQGGQFGIGIGSGLSRNNAFFPRPSASAWHHYALVFDTSAAPSNEITPYVDGSPVAYTKTATGTGAANFANSVLYLMSRAGSALNGAGDLDEVAVYNTALSGQTIANHYAGVSGNQTPSASFSASPNPINQGQTVNFDASASTDADGTIAKYEWDLDGNGSFETDTGTTPTTSKAYTSPGDVSVKLRVTDNGGGTGTATRTVTVQSTNQKPTSSFTASSSSPQSGQAVTFDGAASSDPDGTIAKYEWDLDGNGSFETDTGTTSSASKSYSSADALSIRLRVTDNAGDTAVSSRQIAVQGDGSSYVEKVLGTSGLLSYWRLSETAGNAILDRKGSNDATLTDGTFGAGGALSGSGDANPATSFDGNNDSARAPANLSGTSRVTVEFWLKWNAFAGDDSLAMEFTPNFNLNSGGFLVDPNSSLDTGKFGVALGQGSSRNTAAFNRPVAGAWHHYAFVLDTTAAAASQITPYVDGSPVTFTKNLSGSGAGAFASSQLYFMSRATSSLFGAGDLDEVAVYNTALSAATIKDHWASGAQRPPSPSFTATPNPSVTGEQVRFDASASSDPDGTIAKHEWDLDGNGSYETNTGTTKTATRTYTSTGTRTIRLRVTDDKGATAVTSRTLTTNVNRAPVSSFTITPNPAAQNATVTFDGSASSDPDGRPIVRYDWNLDGNGSFERSTTTPTTTTTYNKAGDVNVQLRVVDSGGATNTSTKTLTVN
jgi:PKD repeat protein